MVLAIGGTAISRFLNSTDNGREVMWSYLRGISEKYPWTGIGWGHEFLSVPHDIVIQTGSPAAHNDFLRLQVELGLIGMPLFYLLLSLAVLIVAHRNSRYVHPTVIIAYLGFLFLSRTDNALAAPSHFPLIILAAMSAMERPPLTRSARKRFGTPPQPRNAGDRGPTTLPTIDGAPTFVEGAE
jgi:hypothetical protein